MQTDMTTALLIGNSDGIGLALTRALLDRGVSVYGLSRSPSPVSHAGYRHHVIDVSDPAFRGVLASACADLGRVDTCVYCAGIGHELDLGPGLDLGLGLGQPELTGLLERERDVFEVNLMGLVATIEIVLPAMLAARHGHIIGLSSLADRFCNPGAPSYGAAKAGMSSYLESMAFAVRKRGVTITNVRFGFVATKMARSDIKPFEISADRAAAVILACMRKRSIRVSHPWRMAALLWLVGFPARLRRALS